MLIRFARFGFAGIVHFAVRTWLPGASSATAELPAAIHVGAVLVGSVKLKVSL